MGHKSRRVRRREARIRRANLEKSERIKAQIAKERGITLAALERKFAEDRKSREPELKRQRLRSLAERKEKKRLREIQDRKDKRRKAKDREERIETRARRKEIRDRGQTLIRTRTITKLVPVTRFKTTTLESFVTTTKEGGFQKQKVRLRDFPIGVGKGFTGVIVGTGKALKTVGVLASKGILGRSLARGVKSFVTQKGGVLLGLRRLSSSAARNVAVSFAQNPLKASGQLLGSAVLFGVAGKTARGLSRLVGKTKFKVSKNVTRTVTPTFSNIRLVSKKGRTIKGRVPSGRKVRTSEQSSRIIADISFRVKLKKGKFKNIKLRKQDIGSLRARAVKNPLVKGRTELLNKINLNVLKKKVSATEKGFAEVVVLKKKIGGIQKGQKQIVFNLKRDIKALKKVETTLTKKQKTKAIKVLQQKIKKIPKLKKFSKKGEDLRRKLKELKRGKVKITKKTIIKEKVFGVASKPKLLKRPPKIKAFLIKAKTIRGRPAKVGVTFVKRKARTRLEKESFAKIQKSVSLLNKRIGGDKFQQFLISQSRARRGGRPRNIVVDTFVNQVIRQGRLKISKGGNRAVVSLEFPALREVVFKGRGVGREFRGSRIRNTVKGIKEVELFKKKRGQLTVREASKILRSLEVPKGRRSELLQKLISKGEVTTIQLSPQFLNSKTIRKLLKKQFKLKLESTVVRRGRAIKIPRIIGLGIQKPKKAKVREIKKFKFIVREKIKDKKKKKFRTKEIIRGKRKFKIRPISVRKAKAKVTPKQVSKQKQVIKLKTPSKGKVKRKVIIKSRTVTSSKVISRVIQQLKTKTVSQQKLKTKTPSKQKLKTKTVTKLTTKTPTLRVPRPRKFRVTFRTRKITKFPKGFFLTLKGKKLRRRVKIKKKKKTIIITAFRSDLISLLQGIKGKIPKGVLTGLEARPIPLRRRKGGVRILVKRKVKTKRVQKPKRKVRVKRTTKSRIAQRKRVVVRRTRKRRKK